MKCPVCKDETLLMSERNGVEIDYCPKCRGIWLDRGELDKIVERARGGMSEYRQEKDARSERDGRAYKDTHKAKKNSPMSALGDILEMFGGGEG